ncbi:protein WVD2-like 4 isoform X2 [Vitis riparia]|uniref:protein WVD2-like 4 isoform X2 n=1 Tax=Vitis riparia TaxID=96939 RepID=UPI00155B05D8|nr:protein WVD2-like 4 isoform X2 [Vitis riparia]
MDSHGRNTGTKTPAKDPQASRSKISEISKTSENLNPNLSSPSPGLKKMSNSPAAKSAKSHKSAQRVISPRNKIRERKFVVAKKNSKKERAASAVTCKCKDKVGDNAKKCLCVAYENLRASQEEFFKIRDASEGRAGVEEGGGEENPVIQNYEIGDGYEGKVENGDDLGEMEPLSESGSACVKRRRDRLLEEARNSGPVSGSGRVAHLVQAFEKLLSVPTTKDSDQKDENESKENKEGMKWALPGLQQPKVSETQASASSFCPSELLLTAEKLGLDSQVSSSWDSSNGSISSRTSGGGRRSRRNSIESSCTVGGRAWKKKQLKATSQKPFKLRTELRGQLKEEELMKKIQKLVEEEEKQRIPIAQGLPWTTDEPECLIKPPVKENTRPIDLKLHSDLRAVERAEFDHQVAEKMSLIEQYKMERERQQKLEEEEEVKRLRKELVPKAQPMPYFDRPFIPRRSPKPPTVPTEPRSLKQPTVPREPRFHIPQQKKIKCCMSWNDMGPYTCHQ